MFQVATPVHPRHVSRQGPREPRGDRIVHSSYQALRQGHLVEIKLFAPFGGLHRHASTTGSRDDLNSRVFDCQLSDVENDPVRVLKAREVHGRGAIEYEVGRVRQVDIWSEFNVVVVRAEGYGEEVVFWMVAVRGDGGAGRIWISTWWGTW